MLMTFFMRLLWTFTPGMSLDYRSGGDPAMDEELEDLLDPNTSVEQIRKKIENFWNSHNGETKSAAFVYNRVTGMAAYRIITESNHYIMEICPLTRTEADMVDTMINYLMEEQQSA